MICTNDPATRSEMTTPLAACPPLAAILAGGAATRLGGQKATAELGGKPLICFSVEVAVAAGLETVIVAKAATALPPPTNRPRGVQVLEEPDEPTHPLLGVLTALTAHPGRDVLVLPCDTPFVGGSLVHRLLEAGSPATTRTSGRVNPLIAVYPPQSSSALSEAVASGASATHTVESLSPAFVEATAEETFNVNTPEDLAYAASIVTRAL